MARIVNSQKNKIENIIKPKKSLSDLGINTITNKTSINENIVSQENNLVNETNEGDLVRLFGSGYSPEEYMQMYDIYQAYLNNYPLRTSNHKLALIKVCRCTLRYNQSVADNDLDALKVWDGALSKALKEAKINPEQLSAADLSDGMTSFSQLSAMVEKAIDIVPLLPQFIEQPKDRVDYALWEYINYVRHLDGKPLIEYKDLYKFLQLRYESLKKRLKFLKLDEDGKFDTNDIDSEV